jgi:hypothetical protein
MLASAGYAAWKSYQAYRGRRQVMRPPTMRPPTI